MKHMNYCFESISIYDVQEMILPGALASFLMELFILSFYGNYIPLSFEWEICHRSVSFTKNKHKYKYKFNDSVNIHEKNEFVATKTVETTKLLFGSGFCCIIVVFCRFLTIRPSKCVQQSNFDDFFVVAAAAASKRRFYF